MCASKDKDCLICICQQYLLIITLWARVQATDGTLSFFDLFDHPAPIGQDRDPDPVPDGRNITLCPALLQFAAQLTNNKVLAGLNGKETRLGFDNQTV